MPCELCMHTLWHRAAVAAVAVAAATATVDAAGRCILVAKCVSAGCRLAPFLLAAALVPVAVCFC